MSERNSSNRTSASGIGRCPRSVIRFLAGFAALLLATTVTAEERTGDEVLVFAAASLKPALDQLIGLPENANLGTIRVSYAASSQLARQIEHGAPASIFISADQDWMNYLDQRELIVRETRIDLIGNALVLIAPTSSTASVDLESTTDLAAALGNDGHLTIAEPDSVPAGKYAKAALTSLGVWRSVEARMVHASDVRAALNFVARGEAALGVVYRSDARSEPRVRVIAMFPENSHAAIVYPAAIVAANDTPAARNVLALLHSHAARRVFIEHGFDVLPSRRLSTGD